MNDFYCILVKLDFPHSLLSTKNLISQNRFTFNYFSLVLKRNLRREDLCLEGSVFYVSGELKTRTEKRKMDKTLPESSYE